MMRPTAGGTGTMAYGETHVIHGVTGDDIREADWMLLSGEERLRCQRLVRPVDRLRFVSAHGTLRRTLAEYLRVAPAQIRFGRRPCAGCGSVEHGAPRVEWPYTSLRFSLARSGPHCLVAVAAGRDVGVDIECRRTVESLDLAPLCLTAAERAYVSEQPPETRWVLFLRCWTRKEAVLKAAGLGLGGTVNLTDVDVDPASREWTSVQLPTDGVTGTAWTIVDLPVSEEVSGAVAGPAQDWGPVLLRTGGTEGAARLDARAMPAPAHGDAEA